MGGRTSPTRARWRAYLQREEMVVAVDEPVDHRRHAEQFELCSTRHATCGTRDAARETLGVRDGTLYAFRLRVVRSHAGLAPRGQSVRDARQPTDALPVCLPSWKAACRMAAWRMALLFTERLIPSAVPN